MMGFKAMNFPKPVSVISTVIDSSSDHDDIILDYFAGSGTTLHALNLLNATDGGNRRCILITNNEVRVC
jgi:adenine-specific DNA-methyltransferase